jgi:UDP-glucose 6-dehydrogenase
VPVGTNRSVHGKLVDATDRDDLFAIASNPEFCAKARRSRISWSRTAS